MKRVLRGGLNLKYINIFDDINSCNISDIKSFYNKCDKVIYTGLSMPSYEYSEKALAVLRGMGQLSEEKAAELFNKYASVNINIARNIVSGINQELSTLIKNNNALLSIVCKILWWFKTEFTGLADGNEHNIYIDFTPSEHEIYGIYLLTKIGNSVMIYDRGLLGERQGIYSKYSNIMISRYNTSENLDIQSNECITEINKSQLIEILNSIVEHRTLKEKHNIIILGTDTDIDNMLVDIRNETAGNGGSVIIFIDGIKPLTPDEVAKIPRPSAKSIQSLSNRIGNHMFAKDEYSDEAVKFLKRVIHKQNNVDQATRKLIEFTCEYNKFSFKEDIFIVFGPLRSEFTWFAQFLGEIGKSVMIVDYSGKSASKLTGNWETIDLGNYVNKKQYPIMKVTNTIAYKASEEIKTTLYSGSNLLHSPRQCKLCRVSILNTTFDELKLLWAEENIYRQGFEVDGEVANIPVIFTSILGLADNNIESHANTLRNLITEHTVVCKTLDDLLSTNESPHMVIHNNTDIYETTFDEQVPFYKNGKIEKEIVLSSKNFTYRKLDLSVQRNIVDKIGFIIENQLISESTIEYSGLNSREAIDYILNILLNIRQDFQKEMQWYDYTKQSPKLILLWNNNDEFKIDHAAILLLLHLCGWDILISSVNGNNILSSNILNYSIQTHIVGEYAFDFDANMLEKPRKAKKGLLSIFLNRGGA